MFDITIILVFIILIFSIIIHELSHGYVAYYLGDPTAKYAGRLTLNPLKHIDIFGSIILPGLLIISSLAANVSGPIFGWAKPVPVNQYNFKDQRWGSLKVSIAGPASNIILALFFGLIIRFVPFEFFINAQGFFLAISFIVKINIMLAVFNLLPIPPLDGSWVFFEFLPQSFEKVKLFLQQYGLFILIFLIFFGGLQWLYYLNAYLFYLFTGIGY